MSKKTIFCFTTGMQGAFHQVIALCEDGRVLAAHMCSDPCFFEGDIGITTISKHEFYDAHCGKDNWGLVWVDNPLGHEGVQTAIKENQKLHPQTITTPQEKQQVKAFQSDDITVGELVRFLNSSCVTAARKGNQDEANVFARLGGQIEYAYNLYKTKNQNERGIQNPG